MSRIVHGVYVAVIVITLYGGFCSSLQIHLEDAVTDNVRYDNLDLESLQVVEPLETNKNDVEIIPEEIGLLFTTLKTKRNQGEDFEEDTIIGEADKIIKQRKTRQVSHVYTPLYPQIPSGPPYNPYQAQPGYNPAGQTPHQQQPPQWNPNTYNYSQPGTPSPHNFNSNTGYHNPNQGAYNYSKPGYPAPNNYNPNTGYHDPNTFNGQNPYNSHPNYPSHNNTSPGNPYSLPNGQYPSNNPTSNYPSHTGSFRPPNTSGSSFTTAWPPSNPRPGQNYNNNSYPGQLPFNNNYPNYPPHSSGNTHPVMTLNSTSQRPPYYNPNQYLSNNNSRPNYSPQYPTATNTPHSYFPGPSPSYNMSQGQYPNNFSPQSPYSSNSTYYPKPSSYPGSNNGQYPTNTNTNFNPNYPQTQATTGFQFSNTYNPSIPNYPPQNNNQGQNNFYYPQRNNSEYDPKRVSPQDYSYH